VLLACLLSAPLARAEAPPSVILILLDTMRADRIGAWGRRDAETPVLDRLAGNGATFLRHHANSHATRASMPQLMTGRYYHPNVLAPFHTHEHPREYDFYRRDPTAVLLPGLLRANGWATIGVSAHAWVVAESDFGRQFDSLELVPFTAAEGHGDGAQVIDRALALWEARDRTRPLFLYLHFMDTHMPRPIPEGVQGPPDDGRFDAGGEPRFDRERRRWSRFDASDFTAEDRAQFTWRYEQRVRYADRQLGRLLAAIERDDPGLRRTLVVVTADHGEELAEDGRVDHTQSLADGVQHIPWIVAGSPVRSGERATRLTEHVDVLPTLLAVLAIPTPSGVRFDGRAQMTADGRVCRSCGRSVALYAWEEYRAARAGRHLLREERPGSPRAHCLGQRLLYRMADGRRTLVPPGRGADALARALARKVSGTLDGPERAFETTRWERASGSVLVRPDFWRLDAGARLRCVPVDLDTPRGFLREPGWLWTERGLVDASDGDRALAIRARLPDGDYDVDAAAVAVPSPPWLFGYGRWLRKSFLEETPGVFVPLGRVRAADGWLRTELPASAAEDRHLIGIRVTPAGMPPRPFGKDGEVGGDEQLERLRALGYVQ
jgi:arylsulfatase A-like enzyme